MQMTNEINLAEILTNPITIIFVILPFVIALIIFFAITKLYDINQSNYRIQKDIEQIEIQMEELTRKKVEEIKLLEQINESLKEIKYKQNNNN